MVEMANTRLASEQRHVVCLDRRGFLPWCFDLGLNLNYALAPQETQDADIQRTLLLVCCWNKVFRIIENFIKKGLENRRMEYKW